MMTTAVVFKIREAFCGTTIGSDKPCLASTHVHPHGSLSEKDNSAKEMDESGSQTIHISSEADFALVNFFHAGLYADSSDSVRQVLTYPFSLFRTANYGGVAR